MDEQGSKQTPAHLASVFADILRPENEIKIETVSKRSIKKKSKEKEIEKEQSKKRKIDPSTSTADRKSDRSKREWENVNRSKPDPIADRELERSLARIATKGVVQLFNAIREHQSLVGDAVNEKGTTTARMEKNVKSIVKKNNFLDLVSKSAKNRKEPIDDHGETSTNKQSKLEIKEVKEEDEEAAKKKWDVLRDDFLLNSAKDWDKDD